MTQTVLILGMTGRFGRNAAEQFSNAGWTVRGFDRAHDDLAKAAQGADVIINAWNPPYTEWKRLVPKLHAQVIDAARQSGATVIVPGNVYVFGEDTPAPWSETSPHGAQNQMGRIRIDMETAYRQSGVRCIMFRSGDFIDTQASGNWLDSVMLKPIARNAFTYLGNPDIDHAWAYLPDMCRATVALAEIRDQLPLYSDIPFPGYTVTGSELASVIGKIKGAEIRVKRFPWFALQLLRPFWRMAARVLEMRYLWNTPHSLDGTLFNSLLPDFRTTPLEQAMASALPDGLGQSQINPDKAVTAGG